MAIYQNVNLINDHIKIASRKDVCYICAKKKGATPNRDAYETMRELQGHIENKKAVFIRKSGIDTFICMDCIKNIYDEHIAPTLVQEVKAEAPAVETAAEVKSEEVQETKKQSKKK